MLKKDYARNILIKLIMILKSVTLNASKNMPFGTQKKHAKVTKNVTFGVKILTRFRKNRFCQ